VPEGDADRPDDVLVDELWVVELLLREEVVELVCDGGMMLLGGT